MPVLRIWHLLSLDAPTLAIVWCLAFAWAAGVPLSPFVLLLLGLATWVAYVGDRVLDARPGRDPTLLRDRHRFYGELWRARRPWLLGSLAAAAAACGVCCLLLPLALVGGYALVTAVSLAYFGVVHGRSAALRRALPKEAVVGSVFAFAASLPVLVDHAQARAAGPFLPVSLAVAIVLLALLAWLNCVCIERWETAPAQLHAADPSTRVAARHAPALLATGAFAAIVATLGARGLGSSPTLARLAPLLAASFLVLWLLDRRRAQLSPAALRISADLALLTPIVALVLHVR